MKLQAQVSLEKNRALIGRVMEVLVEGPASVRGSLQTARSAGQAPEVDGYVFIRDAAAIAPGSFLSVRIENALEYDLVAVPVL
jgi:ribosomal protein S12 methylthiotransferase